MVMRPYQIYAVKAARKRVLEANQNGYVFACTGSGKTLTSFKLAQLLRDESHVDKVVFLIDRKDLDDQTIDEYNSFEKGCVDTSDSTAVLVKQLSESNRKLIVTTIQKMSKAVTAPRYGELMDSFRTQKVVFIIDECHRSQFGKMHGQIKKHFTKANFVGFTGTPIFEENKGSARQTTADIFSAGGKMDACLHRYMIKDAIADGNVLRFSVEYQRTITANKDTQKGIDPELLEDPDYCKQHHIDINRLYHHKDRIRKVAENIFDYHERHVHPQGSDLYTALFAVDSIKTLGRYYDVFKELNEVRDEDKRYKVAAIFSYGTNEDIDGKGDEHSAELLSRIMDDYNKLYGTAFSLDTFEGYRKDISKRMKQKDLPQVDILLVVNMMLTGFDAKPLNTLYLDKNLVWHSLVQAYSRTNRVDKVTKKFGQIVSYRDIKKNQDDALRLFSGEGDPNEYLLKDYQHYVRKWLAQVPLLRKICSTVEAVGQLRSEDEIKCFIIAFRGLVGTLATLKTFSEFEWSDLAVALSEEEYEGYKSWYLYYKDQQSNPKPELPVPVDVDFDIELVRTDRINVVYILSLLKAVTSGEKTEEEKERDIDLIMREIERSDNETLRKKRDVMRAFITQKFYDLDDDADLEQEFLEFEQECQKEEMETFAIENGIDYPLIAEIMAEFSFSGKVSEDKIREKLAPNVKGLLRQTAMTEKVKQFVMDSHNKFKA
jgi:type I restriction enzyme R subunit